MGPHQCIIFLQKPTNAQNCEDVQLYSSILSHRHVSAVFHHLQAVVQWRYKKCISDHIKCVREIFQHSCQLMLVSTSLHGMKHTKPAEISRQDKWMTSISTKSLRERGSSYRISWDTVQNSSNQTVSICCWSRVQNAHGEAGWIARYDHRISWSSDQTGHTRLMISPSTYPTWQNSQPQRWQTYSSPQTRPSGSRRGAEV